MASRRSLVKMAGGLASFNLINTVSAHKGSVTNETSRHEFTDRLQTSLHENGKEGARQLFEKEGMDYNISTKTLQSDQNEGSDISIQNQYPKDESKVSAILGGENNEDRLWFTAFVELNGEQDRIAPSTNVDDLIVIFYESDDWDLVGAPSVNVDYDYDGYGDPEPLDADFFTGSIDNGLSASVNIESAPDPDNIQNNILVDGTVSLMGEFKSDSGTASPIWAGYEHTGSATSSGELLGVNIDLTLASFSAQLGGGASDIWNLAEPGDTTEYI